MKKYILLYLISNDHKKVLMIKRNKMPYKDKWNGVGGKIEHGETPVEACIRECKEETGLSINNPKELLTYVYPESNPDNPGTYMTVLYDFIDEVKVDGNDEGTYEWKDISFAYDFNNKDLAGHANISQMIKEILNIENIKKFYNE